MTNNKNKAFTIAEVLSAVMVACFISMITMVSGAGIAKKFDIMKLKDANLVFKSALNNIMANPVYYSKSIGLEDTSLTKVGKLEYSGNEKFRRLMMKELEAENIDNLQCYIMLSDKKVEGKKLNACYKGNNGIIWGIPDTDFKDLNVVKIKNISELNSYYAPVTIYPDEKHISSEDDFNRYAIVMGVRCDGATTIINSVDCDKKEFKDYNQCKYMEYLANTKVNQEK